MSKHTPGPWQIALDPKGLTAAPLVQTNSRNIAKVLYHGGSEDNEVNANARLIAAAPEMLAELEKIANTCEICEGFGIIEYQPSGIDGYLPTGDANFVTEDCPHCSNVRTIIAKAKGEVQP